MSTYALYDNEILVGLLAQNDEAAFTEIYDRFWKKVFVIAYNRLSVMEEAEDIAHDVFASLWSSRNKVTITALENYLATATKYMVLAKIKRKERERIYNNTLQETPVVELPFEASLHHKQILVVVKKEVEKLPEKCRLIFKYSRNEGLAVKQIAQALNISPKTVENQLHKALKQLRLATKTFLHFFSFLFFL